MAKMDDGDIGGSDPFNVYTGSGSQMFKNERLAEHNKKKRAMEAKRASLPKGVVGLVQELQDIINASRSENDSIGSYLRTMFAQGKQTDPDDIKIEFRAREMNLQLIERIQRCLDKHKTTRPL